METTSIAAMEGNLDILKYVVLPLPLSPPSLFTPLLVINEVVRYAHENGCEWHETTTQRAAHWGQLDCLM